MLAGANTADSLVLNSAGAIDEGAAATLTVVNNATLTAANGVVFDGVTTAGSLNVAAAAGAITDGTAGSLNVANNASFSANGAGGAITLDNAAAHNFGTLTFNSGGAVVVSENSGTTLAGANTADSLVLNSAGAIDEGAAATLTVVNNATLTAANGVVFDGVTTAGSLNVAAAAGAITDGTAGSLNVANNASFSANGAGGAITLDNAAAHNFGTLTFNSGGAVVVSENSGTTLAGANTADSLVLNSAGAIDEGAAATLTVVNNATLTAANGVVFDGVTTAGSLNVATAAGAITDGTAGSLNVANNASFSANGAGGAITLDNAAAHNFGTLTFNSGGAVVVSENSGTSLAGANTADSLVLNSAGAIDEGAAATLTVVNNATLTAANGVVFDGVTTAGSLNVAAAAGAITDGTAGSLNVANNASFSANGAGGAITLDNAAAHNFGTLTFNSGGAVVVSENSGTVLAGANTADSLVLSSAGAIDEGAAATLTVVNNATLTAANGVAFDGVTTAGSLNAAAAAGAITDGTAGSLNVANNASFSANGAGGAITLDNAAAHNFGTLTFNSGGAVVVSENSGTVLAGANTADSLVLSSAGAIDEGAAATLTVVNNATLTAANGVVFDGVTTAGSLNVAAAAGAITDGTAGSLNVANNASFSANGAGGAITLDNAAAHNFGTLTFNSGGAVVVSENSGTVLAGANTADSLVLSSAGAIDEGAAATLTVVNNATINAASGVAFNGSTTAGSLSVATAAGTITDGAAGSLTVANNASFSANGAGGAITLDNAAAHNFGTLTFNSGGAVVVSENSGTVLAGANTADSLVLNSAGAIDEGAAATLAVVNNATINAASGVAFNGSTAAGSLSVATAAGTITDGAAGSLTVANNASFTANGAGGAITLGNDVGNVETLGSLTFNTVGAASISQDNAVVLAGNSSADSLALTAETGTITDGAAGSLSVANNANFTANGAGGGITLDNAVAHNFGTLTFNSGGAVAVSENSDTTLAGANTAGSLVLSSAGAIDDGAAATLTVAGTTTLSAAAGNDIMLDNANDFGGAVGIVSGRNVTLNDVNSLQPGRIEPLRESGRDCTERHHLEREYQQWQRFTDLP